MEPDDPEIPYSFQLAQKAGITVELRTVALRHAHPNTAVLHLTGPEGQALTLSASSLGGGRIRVNAIDGMEASFSGAYPTLIIRNEDRPGIVAEVSQVLSRCNANIAAMQLYRDRRGGLAVMVIECDAPLPSEARRRLAALDGVVRCTYLDMEGA